MSCVILLFYVFAPTRQKKKRGGKKAQAATHSPALTGWQEMSDTMCCEEELLPPLLPEYRLAVRQPKERVSAASTSRHTHVHMASRVNLCYG